MSANADGCRLRPTLWERQRLVSTLARQRGLSTGPTGVVERPPLACCPRHVSLRETAGNFKPGIRGDFQTGARRYQQRVKRTQLTEDHLALNRAETQAARPVRQLQASRRRAVA